MDLEKKIDFKSFITLVEFSAIEKKKKKWKILCLTTDLKDFSQFKKALSSYNYILNDYGDVLKVSIPRSDDTEEESDEKFKSYIVKRKGYYLFFSNENKDDINKLFLNHFIRKVKNIYYIWIPKKVIENLIERFENEFKDFFVTKFYSERDLIDNTPAHFRNNVARKLEYQGDDGLEVIKELKFYYGVRPYIVDFNIINKCSFRINNDGFYTYEYGELNFLIDIINAVYEEVKGVIKLTKSSYYKEVPIKKLKLKTLDIQPIKVNFGSYELDMGNVEDFFEILKEFGFEVFDTALEAGSIKLNTDVIDVNKKAIFNISSGGKELIITPRLKTTFDTIFRLLEIINEKIDSESDYELFKNPCVASGTTN